MESLEAVQFWLNFDKVTAKLSSLVLVNSPSAGALFSMPNFRYCLLLLIRKICLCLLLDGDRLDRLTLLKSQTGVRRR